MLAGRTARSLALLAAAIAGGMATAQTPPVNQRVGGQVVTPQLLTTVPPVYPLAARVAHVEGKIVLEIVIGKDGHVTRLKYVSGPAVLVQAAMDAVKQWIYSPSTLDGAPAEAQSTAELNFTLTTPPAAASGAGPTLAADPFAGTWEPADFKKWKIGSDTPKRIKSESIAFEATAKDQYRYTRIPSDGTPDSVVWIVDGKEHPLGETTQVEKTERIDERHLRGTSSSGLTDDWVVSPDGKTLTDTRKGVAHGGRSVDEVFIYEKK